MSEQKKLNIHQKLVEIRRNIGGFTKDKKSFNYSYVSGTQVLAKIQEKMNELGVLLIPEVTTQEFEKHNYKNKKGAEATDFLVYGHMNYTWVNAENPEDCIKVPFYYTGAQDDISKAFGSGLTYSERYFVIKFFNLPTDADDPDARDTSGRSSYNQNNQYRNQNNYQKQPQQQPQQNNNGISDAQIKAMKAKLSNLHKNTGIEMQMIYVDTLKQCNIPEQIATKDLSKAQAIKVITALAEREAEFV